MCGIVGLFLKDRSLEPQLGALLSDMLITMSDRGPDSAGIAIYGSAADGRAKVTLQSAKPKVDFAGLAEDLSRVGAFKLEAHFLATFRVPFVRHLIFIEVIFGTCLSSRDTIHNKDEFHILDL